MSNNPLGVKHNVTIQSSNSTLTHMPNIIYKIYIYKTFTQVDSSFFFFFNNSKRRKQNVHPLMNNLWHIFATEYYVAIKRNEALAHATKRMNLENIMLSV